MRSTLSWMLCLLLLLHSVVARDHTTSPNSTTQSHVNDTLSNAATSNASSLSLASNLSLMPTESSSPSAQWSSDPQQLNVSTPLLSAPHSPPSPALPPAPPSVPPPWQDGIPGYDYMALAVVLVAGLGLPLTGNLLICALGALQQKLSTKEIVSDAV